MTTLVTGATGLIGSHVVDELLLRGESVRALVRDPSKAAGMPERGVDVVVGDLSDAAAMQSAVQGVDVIHHCAAAVGGHFTKREIYETNLTGVQNLLEAVRQGGHARVVLLSSVNVLGTCNMIFATEDLPYQESNDPPADVKIAAEKLALEYHRQHELDVVILRPGFVYGPRDSRNLPKLIRSVRRGKFRFIDSPKNITPIVHVSDVVQAMLLAAATPAARGRIYNVTDGSRTTIGKLVNYLAELTGSPPPTRVMPFWLLRSIIVGLELWNLVRRGERSSPITRTTLRFLGTSRFVDITRTKKELGYAPQFGYREGIAATYQWLEEQAHAEANLAHAPA